MRSAVIISVFVPRVMWTYKGNVNSALGENLKKTSSSAISTDTSFNDSSNQETLNGSKVYQ